MELQFETMNHHAELYFDKTFAKLMQLKNSPTRNNEWQIIVKGCTREKNINEKILITRFF